MARSADSFQESGFRVDLPQDGFRFERLAAYQRRLSHRGVHEMDFAFADGPKQDRRLVLVELLSKTFTRKTGWREQVAKKITDSLLMLGSAWLDAGLGKEIAQDLPSAWGAYPGDGRLRVCVVVDQPRDVWTQDHQAEQSRELADHIGAWLDLFGLDEVLVIDRDSAADMGIPLQANR